MRSRVVFAVLFCPLLLVMAGCNRRNIIVGGESMEPTFKKGDSVTADMSAYKSDSPKRWDLVAVRPKAADLKDVVWILRVIGLPGETVSFSDGHILIDGKVMAPPPAVAATEFRALSGIKDAVVHPFAVPEASYYLLGDNQRAAFDSRMWGALPRANILGKVLAK